MNPAQPLEDIDGVGAKTAAALREAGYQTVGDIRAAPQRELASINGVGDARAERIKRNAAPNELEDVFGVGPTRLAALRSANFETVKDVRTADQATLARIEGIGDRLAARILRDVGGEDEPSTEGHTGRSRASVTERGGWGDDKV
jgi:excinuclease UvrABC nuclease subunit